MENNMGEGKKIESIFDVDIKTGNGNGELEKVIVKPNPDKAGVLSVFLLKKGESEPRKYYDISLSEAEYGLKELLIEGDERMEFVRLEGNAVRRSIARLPKISGNVVECGLLVTLERSFTKLKIEVTPMILFTAT
jgi:hypothetical protein